MEGQPKMVLDTVVVMILDKDSDLELVPFKVFSITWNTSIFVIFMMICSKIFLPPISTNTGIKIQQQERCCQLSKLVLAEEFSRHFVYVLDTNHACVILL